MIRLARPFLLFLCFFSLLPKAVAGDFMDTRITFAIADDNLLAGPGLTNPNSPSTSFVPGPRSNLFFDNYDTRFSGFESLSHIALYKEMPSFFSGLVTAAALVVRMEYFLERKEFRLVDAGSYIEMVYYFNREDALLKDRKKLKLRRNLELVAFPLSSDRFRLGYSFRISWGGDSTFPRRSVKSPVPGAKLQLNYDFTENTGIFAFIGAKTALLQQLVTREQIEEETAFGVLGGIGFRAGGFRIEGGAAVFDKGTFFNPSVKGERIYFYGFSGQVSYNYGMPIGVSIDFQLYRNDPDLPQKFFALEQYTPGKFSFSISSEFSYVNNQLEDPDPARVGGITDFPGIAADLNFRMKYGYFRLHADIVYRDLGFILTNVPGFVPFQAFAKDQVVSPEFFAAVGIDYYIAPAHLTIGLKGGVQLPATFRGPLPTELIGGNPSGSLRGEQIVVIRNEGDFVLLPPTDAKGNKVDVLPIFSAKLNFKWDLSQFMSLIGELLLSVDSNETRLVKSQGSEGSVNVIYTRDFVNPIRFGFNVIAQARF